MRVEHKLPDDGLKEMFENFPENIQGVMYGHGCDSMSVENGELSVALYEEYEYVRDKLFALCGDDQELKKRVLTYLIGVYP